jgi:RimJ/RimL family protein N-acetyltransferase
VEQKETGTFVGIAGFADPYDWPGFELAGSLARRWWRHGYATEAGRAALAYAFTALNKDRVISLIHPENLASIRAAERLGETLQGRTEMMGHDRLVYGIDRESYATQPEPRGDLALPVVGQGWNSLAQAENPRI